MVMINECIWNPKREIGSMLKEVNIFFRMKINKKNKDKKESINYVINGLEYYASHQILLIS